LILSLKESTFGFISTPSLSQSSEAVPSHLSLSEKRVATIFSSKGSGVDIKPNVLSLRLSINASRLFRDYGIRYQNSRTHNGRKVSLWKETDESM